MANILIWVLGVIVFLIVGGLLGLLFFLLYKVLTDWKIKRNIPTSLEPEDEKDTKHTLAYAGKEEKNEKEVTENYERERNKARTFEKLRRLGNRETESDSSEDGSRKLLQERGSIPSRSDKPNRAIGKLSERDKPTSF